MRKIFTSLASIVVCGLALSSGAFADANLTFEVVVPDEPLIEISLLNSDGSALSGNTSIDLTPTTISGSFFNEKNMTVNVGTNNEWGYNLVMSVSNTSLISTEDGSKTIPTLASKDGGYTCTAQTANTCDFTANTWGYKLNTATNLSAATNYLPLQSSITLNSSSAKVLTPESTSVAFGSKVNADLAPGTYSTTINFIATANPDPTPVMQNVSASDLASLTSSNSTVTLKDERDGTKYTIGKLADGNYWMLDNLALDLTNSTTLNNTTASNTNASATTLNYLKGTSTGTTSDKYATTGVSNWTTSHSYSAPLVNATSKDQTQPLAMGQSGTGKVGVYYNYCAASAGSYCYGNGTSGGSPSGNASEDICPKGWRMPTGGSSGEYQALYTAYSSNKANFVNALKTPFSGVFNNGSARYQGSLGYFWSSTYYGTTSMYYLGVDASNVSPQNGYGRSSGASIRCLFYIPTMQSMTNGTLAEKMPTSGSTTVLKDSRDGNNYQITNINGTYWMTDNLRFTGTNLTPADTNVTQNTKMTYTDLSLGNDSTVARMHYDTTDPNSNIYGAYYNVCAASAGTLCNETTSANITSDICPKGWKMPTEANAQALKNSGVDWNLIAAGFYGGGSLISGGSMGYWWLSTGGSGVGAWTTYRILYYTSNNNLNVDGYGSRWYGGSIRCVAGS